MSVNLSEVINSHINNYDSQLHTSIPAKVLEVTSDTGITYVKVQPSLNKVYSDGLIEAAPTINKVPIVFPSGGGGLLSFPIEIGDTVLLVFSQKNIANWLIGDGSNVTPETLRTHDLNDAIAIPGLYPFSNNLEPNQDDVELKFQGSRITLKASGDIEVDSSESDSGNVKVTTNNTFSVNNSSEELVSLLSELIDTCSKITTSTIYGPQTPCNNLADFTALKTRLDTFKES